jgi:hypothetical protein
MQRNHTSALAAATLALALVAGPVQGQDESRMVANGGVHAPGWMGKIDASEAAKGAKLDHSSLAPMGGGFHVTTGPAVAYWNPANTATGNYTVKATFREPEYMNLNNHPHPYGIVIAGSDMGTDTQSYLYCAAYGNGRFIVRGFGPEPFQANGRGEEHPAVKKAAEKGATVVQEIAVTVTGDAVQCAINGTVVGTYPKSDLVGTGKLKSTDGVYGIRFGHNTEAMVTGLTMVKN